MLSVSHISAMMHYISIHGFIFCALYVDAMHKIFTGFNNSPPPPQKRNHNNKNCCYTVYDVHHS